MQASDGEARYGGAAARASPPLPRLESTSRVVEATAMPTASSVITVSAPLATDRSARINVTSVMIAKKPAAASVSHIGEACELQSWSSDVGKDRLMSGSYAMVPYASSRSKSDDR